MSKGCYIFLLLSALQPLASGGGEVEGCRKPCQLVINKCLEDPKCRTAISTQERACASLYDDPSNPNPNCTAECQRANGLFLTVNPELLMDLSCCDCGSSEECTSQRSTIQKACRLPHPSCPTETCHMPVEGCRKPCERVYNKCLEDPKCRAAFSTQERACASLYDDPSNPNPNCTAECQEANGLFLTVNPELLKDLGCCDCGSSEECTSHRNTFHKACRLPLPNCPTKTCPHIENTCGHSCTEVYAECSIDPDCSSLLANHSVACATVNAFNGTGEPPMCPNECQAVNQKIFDMQYDVALGCCTCDGPTKEICQTVRRGFFASCGGAMHCSEKCAREQCPSNCRALLGSCFKHNHCSTVFASMLDECQSAIDGGVATADCVARFAHLQHLRHCLCLHFPRLCDTLRSLSNITKHRPKPPIANKPLRGCNRDPGCKQFLSIFRSRCGAVDGNAEQCDLCRLAAAGLHNRPYGEQMLMYTLDRIGFTSNKARRDFNKARIQFRRTCPMDTMDN